MKKEILSTIGMFVFFLVVGYSTLFIVGKCTEKPSASITYIKVNATENITMAKADVAKRTNVRKIKPPYKYSELSLLAHLIYAEVGASYEPDIALEYCGSVVLNRVKSKHFPNSIRSVIYQHGQYACVSWFMHREPSTRAWEIAEELLIYGSSLPRKVLYQAEFRQANNVYTHIGRTYFCY